MFVSQSEEWVGGKIVGGEVGRRTGGIQTAQRSGFGRL